MGPEMTGTGTLFAAVDVGTTGARAVVVDLDGERVVEVRRPYATVVRQPGWAEQDAADWARCSLDALAGVPAELRRGVVAIGLTGQSPSVAPVDADGVPVGPGMIYRDNRAVAEASEMRDLLGARHLHDVTGHTPEAFHIGPKVLWLRRHEPDTFARTRWFLQPRDVVLHRLTGRFLTDESHANCTLFYDLEGHCWADEILDAMSLDRVFPDALPSWAVGGELRSAIADELGLPRGIPVVVGAGDSQCVAFGAGVVARGPISEMAGASSCLNSAVDRPRRDLRITHYNHALPGWYTTELGVNTTGAALQWAVAELGFADFEELGARAAAGLEALPGRAASAGALDAAPLFLPYLGDGERDDPAIRGAFVGLSDRHDRSALAYAVVEGVAAGVAGVVDVLRRAGSPLDELRVSGGGARLGTLGQVKSSLLGVPVLHLRTDASAIGAAMLAAGGVGYAGAASAALEKILGRAERFEPDTALGSVLEERREWFRRVRRAAAVHVPAVRRR